jgi:hypothetical protein
MRTAMSEGWSLRLHCGRKVEGSQTGDARRQVEGLHMVRGEYGAA